MKNEAKLGLLAGVAAVLLVASVFYQKKEPSLPTGPATAPLPTAPAKSALPSVPVSRPAVSGGLKDPIVSPTVEPPLSSQANGSNTDVLLRPNLIK